ncbi:MAG: hypothetical protein U0163_11285 [Gemmatimonadaceae bacterium]
MVTTGRYRSRMPAFDGRLIVGPMNPGVQIFRLRTESKYTRSVRDSSPENVEHREELDLGTGRGSFMGNRRRLGNRVGPLMTRRIRHG